MKTPNGLPSHEVYQNPIHTNRYIYYGSHHHLSLWQSVLSFDWTNNLLTNPTYNRDSTMLPPDSPPSTSKSCCIRRVFDSIHAVCWVGACSCGMSGWSEACRLKLLDISDLENSAGIYSTLKTQRRPIVSPSPQGHQCQPLPTQALWSGTTFTLS